MSYGLVDIIDVSSVGFQSMMFWGLVYQVKVLKDGVPIVGFKPITTHGEPPDFEFPPN